MELGEHLLQAWMVGLDKWLAKHWPASLTYSPGLPSIVTHFLSSLVAPQKAGLPLKFPPRLLPLPPFPVYLPPEIS